MVTESQTTKYREILTAHQQPQLKPFIPTNKTSIPTTTPTTTNNALTFITIENEN
jgi:hypothetical protein